MGDTPPLLTDQGEEVLNGSSSATLLAILKRSTLALLKSPDAATNELSMTTAEMKMQSAKFDIGKVHKYICVVI